jgi:hypothetical protein
MRKPFAKINEQNTNTVENRSEPVSRFTITVESVSTQHSLTRSENPRILSAPVGPFERLELVKKPYAFIDPDFFI